MNTRRNLIKGIIALLIVASILVVGAYLIRQNYKEHHYITGTVQYGRYRGEKYRITEAHQDEINRRSEIATEQQIDRARKQWAERKNK